MAVYSVEIDRKEDVVDKIYDLVYDVNTTLDDLLCSGYP